MHLSFALKSPGDFSLECYLPCQNKAISFGYVEQLYAQSLGKIMPRLFANMALQQKSSLGNKFYLQQGWMGKEDRIH